MGASVPRPVFLGSGTAPAPLGGTVVPSNPMQQASMAQQGALAGTAAAGMTPIGTVAGSNLSPYMNPYTRNVIGGLQQEAARGMAIGANQLGAQATQAGAFGGSRHGIAQGQMMGDIMRGVNQQTGQLLQSGFQNAQQMAQADIQNRLAQANLGLNAAQQLGGLGQQSFGYGQQIQQNLAQQGQQQQVLQQALIDAAKGQYGNYMNYPAQGLGIMSQALGATQAGSTTQQSRSPGLMDYLTAGASIYALSDVRLKESIKKVGELANGIGVYTWKWTKEAIKAGKAGNMFKGVLAQEVRKVFPDAVVVGQDGYMRVNYSHPELKGAI